MIDIGFFIDGGTVDNAVIMRQWQLCQEAQLLDATLDNDLFGLDEGYNFFDIDRVWDAASRRLQRRISDMVSLISEWNEAEKIYWEHGEEIKAAILRAL